MTPSMTACPPYCTGLLILHHPYQRSEARSQRSDKRTQNTLLYISKNVRKMLNYILSLIPLSFSHRFLFSLFDLHSNHPSFVVRYTFRPLASDY